MSIVYSIKSAKGLKNIESAKPIRIAVFMEEQGFQSEFDDIDDRAFHVVLFDGKRPVGTGRCFNDDNNPKNFHIGRVAIVPEYRKKNLGEKIINSLENIIKNEGGETIELSSQVRAKTFYKKQGYVEEGNEYLDEFCPHIKMTKRIK